MIHKFSAIGFFAFLVAQLVAADEIGVLCRFNGQIDPTETIPIWNSRWDIGPGIETVNNDCEAIVNIDSDAANQWVGAALPHHLSYIRTRVEVGVEPNFVMADGDGIAFLEVEGEDLSGSEAPPHLVRVSLARPTDPEPDEFELQISWWHDNGQETVSKRGFYFDAEGRMLFKMDWFTSSDMDGDFLPDRDALLRLYVHNELEFEVSGLLIDRLSPTELKFGYLGGCDSTTVGEFYFRPLGVDAGYFELNE